MGGITCKKSRKVSNAWYTQLESPVSEILFKGVLFHERIQCVYSVHNVAQNSSINPTMVSFKKKLVTPFIPVSGNCDLVFPS